MYEAAGAGEVTQSLAPVHALGECVAALGEAWTRALPPFGMLDGDPSALVDQFSDAGLLAVVDALGALTRRADALGAAVAAEVARRSPTGTRSGNLARTAGHASPGRLVAASRGGQIGRAVELVMVGQRTAARRTLAGEALPPVHPYVAAALHAGRISVDAAHLIIAMFDRVAPRADPAEMERTEALLTSQAAQFPLHQLTRLVDHAEKHLDTGGAEPREETRRAARSVTLRSDSATGMLLLTGRFDPETGAPIKTALDAYVTARLRETRGHNHPDAPDSPAESTTSLAGTGTDGSPAGTEGSGSPATPAAPANPEASVETRSVPQLQADALADFARHILGCDTTKPLVPAITMVVRVDLADLQSRDGGRGYATVDGVDQPVSAATARKLACDAGLIPAVFGGHSLPLDLGRRSRTFTRAQVLALWERDGGCAFCGQTTFVEAHHIRWWYREKGTTDLSNAVLLCSRCHHLIHRDGWAISVDDAGEISFAPPQEIDPDRAPRSAAPNPRRLFGPKRQPSDRPPDRDDAHTRPPAGPGRTAPGATRTERLNPAIDERRLT